MAAFGFSRVTPRSSINGHRFRHSLKSCDMRPAGFMVIIPVLALLFAGCGRSSREQLPEPGTDLYALAPSATMEVSFSTDQFKLFAFRWTNEGPFQLVIARRGGTVGNCHPRPKVD